MAEAVHKDAGGALAARVIAAVRAALPGGARASLHEPVFAGREWDYVKDCLDTGWVSTVGAYVGRFERALEAATGARHAIACVNGTAALHVAYRLAGVRPDDEVLAPTLTFIATINAIAYCGAVPHFCEIEDRSLGIDPEKLDAHLSRIAERRGDGLVNRETGRPIRALVVLHTFGHAARIEALQELARRWGFTLIEDAAEALGARYKGRHLGTFGALGTLSFNGNKIVTTGGGGAILTDDDALAARARHLTTTARVPAGFGFVHDEVGYNYRLPNINAALGCAQLEQLSGFLAAKRALAARYAEAFASEPDVRFVVEPEDATSNYWLNAILLAPEHAGRRDVLIAALNDAGYGARPLWTLMHRLPMFVSAPRMALDTAEDIERRLVNLPSGAALGPAA